MRNSQRFFDGFNGSIRNDSSGVFLFLPRVATIGLLLDSEALNFFRFLSSKSINSPELLPRVATSAGELGAASTLTGSVSLGAFPHR